MSARIVVNLSNGQAGCAIDRSPDGGTWLSLHLGSELVLVKLSPPSLVALHRALGKHLAVAADGATRADAGDPGSTPAASGRTDLEEPALGAGAPAADGGRG